MAQMPACPAQCRSYQLLLSLVICMLSLHMHCVCSMYCCTIMFLQAADAVCTQYCASCPRDACLHRLSQQTCVPLQSSSSHLTSQCHNCLICINGLNKGSGWIHWAIPVPSSYPDHTFKPAADPAPHYNSAPMHGWPEFGTSMTT